MLFDELVNFIRERGCKVIINSTEILKQTESMGYFISHPEPEICIAISGHIQEELIRTLLHEYAHFLQHKDGFMGKFDEFGWTVFNRWLDGTDFKKEELVRSQNAICLIEYDAEIRTIKLATELDIDIGSHLGYIKDAYAYISTIKWSFLNRIWLGYYPPGSLFNTGYLTPQQVIRPLTICEIDTINREAI